MSDQNHNGNPNDNSDGAAPNDQTPETPAPDAAQIRAEIEATRAEMSQTIDAIQDKLDPEHIKAEVIGKVHDATIGQAQHLAQVAGEKLQPAKEKLEEASEKISEMAKPVAQQALAKRGDALKLAARYPVVTGGVAAALVFLFWALFPRDQDEVSL